MKPVADAGGNQSVTVGALVTLDGRGSSDANRDPLTYEWSIVTKPAGSSAVLAISTPDDPIPGQARFTADTAGDYVISLVVRDGFVNSDPSNVTVTALPSLGQASDVLSQVITTINGASADAFKNPNMRHALTNKLVAVLKLVGEGLDVEAVAKLRNDVLQKTDGCANAGAPDRNDWITDCAVQAEPYLLVIEAIGILEEAH